MILLLQNVYLIPKDRMSQVTKTPIMVDVTKRLKLPQMELLKGLSKAYSKSGINDETEESEEVTQVIQDLKPQDEKIKHLRIPKDKLAQIVKESSIEWTSEAVKFFITWFLGVCETLNESESLKDLKLQLISVSRMDRESGIPEDLMEHLAVMLKNLMSQVLENKNISRETKNPILDHITFINMGLLSLVGNISNKDPTYKKVRELLSKVNEARMDPDSKTLRDFVLSMLEVLFKRKHEDLKDTGLAGGIPEDQILDKLIMIFKYLLPVSLSASQLTEIRMTLKHQLSMLMDVSRIDPVSGLPKDLLSLLVYSFFPSSHMYFHIAAGSHQLVQQYIFKPEECEEIIYTGSLPENLHLPYIHELLKDESHLFPDTDLMIDTRWFCKCYHTMSLEIDEAQPVFCRIKHGMDLDCNQQYVRGLLPAVSDGPYFNSAKINYLFRRYHMNHLQYKKYYKETKSDYDSASMAFTAADPVARYNTSSPVITQNDFLFCIPVQWSDKENFLRRLKPDTWPMNSISDLGRLLTEQVYAVPKPDANSGTGDLRWRLSFSIIEITLARSLTDMQRRCYRVLKAIIKHLLNVSLSGKKQFPSYYLKTAMFWFCESTSERSWTIQTLGLQWLKLLDSVIDSLERKELLMYFIPTYNLLKDKDVGTVRAWKERLKKIREEPLKAFIQFWSANEIEIARCEDWQHGIYTCLISLYQTYTNATFTEGIFESQQHKYHEATCTCFWFIAKYLLATYSLGDFLKYVNYYPQTKKLILNAEAESKEHLVWMFYNEFLSVGFPPYPKVQVPDNYSSYWTYLAEITHHISLKYQDEVPDKDLFSKQTVRMYYLIACSVQNKVETFNSQKYIKYANYLQDEKKYEEATHVLMKVCQTSHWELRCTFNKMNYEVLDTCLKLTVVFQEDVSHAGYIFAYHLLTSCYTQAGVLAEVCFNQHVGWKVLLGFQFIICEQLQNAFQTFTKIHDGDLLYYTALSFNIKYSAMLYIIARLSISETN